MDDHRKIQLALGMVIKMGNNRFTLTEIHHQHNKPSYVSLTQEGTDHPSVFLELEYF